MVGIRTNVYAYTFVCTRATLPCHIFGLCPSVCVPLSPDRGLPLSPNSVLHVRPQISTERPQQFIVGLIRYTYYEFAVSELNNVTVWKICNRA